MMLLALLLACSTPPKPEEAWKEVPPPRPDMQCWLRWGRDIVCAPSLKSTHGASP